MIGAWRQRSLRWQLLAVFIFVELLAGLVLSAVLIARARTSTAVEIAASMNLAEALVTDALRASRDGSIADILALPQRTIRHIRIVMQDERASAPATNEPQRRSDDRMAPTWFSALVAPPPQQRTLPVIVNGQRTGTVLIIGEPGDEVAEAWENAMALAGAALLLNLVIAALFYFLVGRVLRPLSGLAAGLVDLEAQNYGVALTPPNGRELGSIAERFNALARALDELREHNRDLGRRLITAQEDERRRTALELHDEVGPCLFGLRANASSLVERAPNADVAERSGEMLKIVEHLQLINRGLLNRLRPMSLGHVPLREVLTEAVRERGRQHPELTFGFMPGELQRSYGDAIDLTLYRCIQESLTNAARHAAARKVTVDLAESPDSTALHLVIADDGQGIVPEGAIGHGLHGMQERVGALGGTFNVAPGPEGGTVVRIRIPLASGPASGNLAAMP